MVLPRPRKPIDVELPADNPNGLPALAIAYLTSLRVRGYSESTIEEYQRRLRDFLLWCDDRSLSLPTQITIPIIERYQYHLSQVRRTQRGKLMTIAYQRSHLDSITGFFRWLLRRRHIPSNPAGDLEKPRVPVRLPRLAFSMAEAEQLMAIPDLSDLLGLRLRAMLEMLYSTGMRRFEMAALYVSDLFPERHLVSIRKGKGGRNGFVPIGDRALDWLEKYQRDVRPRLVIAEDPGYLFLTTRGEQMGVNRLTTLVRNAIVAAGLGKDRPGAAHLLRHTMATLMLENGADIRVIQDILGHMKLDTTAIYTHVAIGRLIEVHAATHPGAVGKAGIGKAIPNQESVMALDALLRDDEEIEEEEPEKVGFDLE